MIHPEAKFLFSHEPVKTNYLFPHHDGGTGLGGTFSLQKGEIREKEGVLGPPHVPTLAEPIPLDFKARK